MNGLLAPEVQEFIRENTGGDLTKLALKKNPFPNLTYTDVLAQIAARQKAKDKLPTWFATESVLYPSTVSVEQTSSEPAARHKASLVNGRLIDLTGGFGVDSYYFAKSCENVIHCEINPELSQTAAYNLKLLGADNISFQSVDGNEYLKSSDETFDWIYVDPSRRHDIKGKVFHLSDCSPHAAQWLDYWLEKAPNVMIKTAPLLDFSAGLRELKNIRAIHIVSLKGELRELLWIAERDYSEDPEIIATELASGETFTTRWQQSAEVEFSHPLRYLYEPSAALMKTGAFAEIGMRHNLKKLHLHSHLYTSDKLTDFMGRKFEVEEVIPYSKSTLKPFAGMSLNVTARNFPESVDTIRKRWKIKEGGNRYAFFTTDVDEKKIVLLCKKIDA